MNALLFRARVAVLWVAVAVAMSGSLLLALYAPGALEELLAGEMEGETLDSTWGILFAAMVVIPLVMALTAAALGLLIAGLSVVELRKPTSREANMVDAARVTV